jgi:SAM-dependent methyltransferase
MNNLPNARGYLDMLDIKDGKLFIQGWILHPDIVMDSFKVVVDGNVIHEAPLVQSDGMAKVFPFVKHAQHSVFRSSMPYVKKSGVFDIAVIGCKDGRDAAKLETWFSEDLRPDFAFPDVLKVRVANNAKKEYFSASSFTSFRNYYEPVQRHSQTPIKNMLDWGCGCGRLIVMFSRGTPIPGIYGCDIDKESIAWCKENLAGNFDVIPLVPPTRYADNFFDLVISNSVLTHLTKDIQLKWLAEMRRIIAPGGLFVASVHGEFATYFNFAGEVDGPLKKEINDETKDHNLDGLVPNDYYRGTFQTRAYTERVFSEYFEILDYIEAGSLNFQDIVVMRKRA